MTERYTLRSAPPSVELTSSVLVADAAEQRAAAAARGVALRAPLAARAPAARAAAPLATLGLAFPALAWDGVANTTLALAGGAFALSGPAAWGVQRATVAPIAGRNLTWEVEPDLHYVRNGLFSAVRVSTPVATPAPSMTLSLAPTSA